MTCETPSDEIDRSSSMPLMVLTASSILSVISVSICSGAAPGWTRGDHDRSGSRPSGKRSTPSCVNEKAPTTVSDRMRTVAKTGRLTQSAASHCMIHLHFTLLHAVGELRDVRGRDPLAGLEALVISTDRRPSDRW